MSASSSLVFPVLGVVLSNALYFSPAPAVVRAASVGNLGSLNPIPLALMVVSTFAWMCYAFAVPNGFIVASNLPGAVAAVGFVATTLPLIPADAVSTRRTVGIALTGGALVSLLLWTYLTFAHVDHDTLVFVLGAHGSAICVLLFASPLSTLKEVLVTANAVSIYGPLTAAQCTNCAMWTICAPPALPVARGPIGAAQTESERTECARLSRPLPRRRLLDRRHLGVGSQRHRPRPWPRTAGAQAHLREHASGAP